MSATIPSVGAIYRLVTPTVTADATGAATEVDANKTFVTNLPLNYYLSIQRIRWFATIKATTNFLQAANSIQQIQAQIVESQNRTKVNLVDPNYISNYFDEVATGDATAVAYQTLNRAKAYWIDDITDNPWATVATTLNLVHTELPIAGNGLKVDITAILEYSLLPTTPQIQQYLSSRIQITGAV